MERADIIRYDNDRLGKIISFNINELTKNMDVNNLKLEPNDLVRVYPKNIFKQNFKVRISGEVNKPGTYQFKANMNIKDLIIEAGGLTRDLFRYKAEIARIDPEEQKNIFAKSIVIEIDNDFNLLNNDGNLEDYLLEPYDYVFLRRDPFLIYKKQ